MSQEKVTVELRSTTGSATAVNFPGQQGPAGTSGIAGTSGSSGSSGNTPFSIMQDGENRVLTTNADNTLTAETGLIVQGGHVDVPGKLTVTEAVVSGSLTVTGDLTVSGNLKLGDAATDTVITRGDLHVGDDAFFGDTVTVSGDSTVRNVNPATSGIYDIGTSDLFFGNIYAKTGHFDAQTIVLGSSGAKITSEQGKIR